MKGNPSASRIWLIAPLLLAIFLLFSCEKKQEKPTTSPEDFCVMLEGNWTNSNNEFVTFADNDGAPSIFFGLWNAGVGRGFGVIEKVDELADGAYQLTVHFPEQPATEMTEAYHEMTTEVFVDLGKSEDQTISVKKKGGKYDTYTYSVVGLGPEASGHDSEKMSEDEIWSLLEGVWTNPDDNFIEFAVQKGIRTIAFGKWNTGGSRGGGDVYQITWMADGEYSLSVHYPAVEQNGMQEAYDEEYITVDLVLSNDEISYYISMWNHSDGGFLKDA